MIYQIIEEIKADPSKNAKIAILKKNESNELLKRVIVACYSPYVQYYIRKIPDYSCEPTGLELEDALDQLSKLSNREVTGHAAQAFLLNLLVSLNPEDAYILTRVILKSMDAGFSESTANKVWKKLVPTYPCLLAKGCDEKTIKRMTFPAFSQLKADGMRVNVHVNDAQEASINVSLCGRSGKAVNVLGELDADIIKLASFINHPEGDFMLDGELVLIEDDGTVMERKKGNGKLNKAIRGKMPADEAMRVRIRVWDIVGVDSFKAEKDDMPYNERYEIVKNAVAAYDASFTGKENFHNILKGTDKKIEIIETIEVADMPEAEAHFAEMLKRGEEGTILKSFDHVWEDKRSYGLLKMKAIKDADLEVVGWVEGSGKYEGMLGALVCQSSDGKVEVNVGSGFSDEQRKKYTEKNTVGRIIEIIYNERISSRDRTNVDSLFLPRFIELREDKDVANSSAEIS